ncbi:MAG: WGR domain-containing protein [Spirochaetes bacterium]|nr:MAG: WGR domain-containing protein [Spirochaetota bacterium]
MGKAVKLILISGEVNSNKFYNMTDNDNGTFTVEYGRVGASMQTQSYPISQWDKKYKEKTNKGYKDNTDLFIVEDTSSTNTNEPKKTGVVKEFLKSRTQSVMEMVKKLQGWAKGSIQENYTVSSEQVTQKQVERAQALLDNIVTFDLVQSNVKEFNNMLLEFFGVVPRKMKQVKDHLISESEDLTKRKNQIISEEQATLDVMAGQVKLNADITEEQEETHTVETDIIHASGLEMEEVTDTDTINKIKGMMADNKHKFKKAFAVVNTKTQKMYDNHVANAKNKKEELFWHGSRNENWWSIMTSGLMIRPSNAVYSGSMFGDGIYFADRFQKSYGYTSGRNSYWAKGNSNEAILALYTVHIGEQKHIYKHDSSCYKLNYNTISKDGYDSVFAHGGIDLRNNEYMIYQAQQCTIKYLVIVEA